MPIDPSIALAGKAPQIENPLNYLVQAQQLQQGQNQNALFPLEMQMRQLQMRRAQAQYDALSHLFDPASAQQAQGQNFLAQPLAAGPQGPMPGGSIGQPADQTGAGGASGNALATPAGAASATILTRLNHLAASGVDTKQLFDQYKFGIEGGQINPGYRLNPATGRLEYYADPTKGLDFNPATGQVSAMPGFAAANAGIEGAKSAATTRAVNDNTVADPSKYIGADGKPFAGTVGQLLGAVQGKAADAAAPAGPRFVGADLLDQLPPEQAAAIRADAAKSGGKATINMNTPDGRHVQGEIDLTRAAGGYTPPSVGQDGHPIPQPLQAALSRVADSRDPAQLQALEQQLMGRINAMPDSPQKQAAIQNVRAEAQKIEQSWQAPAAQPGQPAQPAPGFSFASPNDLAMDRARQEAALKQQTDPMIKFKTDLLSKAHESNAATLDKLQDTVRSEFEIQNRNKQLMPLLDKIQTGGFTPEGRIDLANKLQTSGLVPDALKGTLSTWIANGDPTTGKVIENQLAAAGIKTMLDTLDKEGKPNRAIFDAIQNAQESVRSGNATLKQVFALQKQLYDMHYQQEQDMTHAIASPDYNPLTMQADFSRRRNATLSADQPTAGAPAAAAAAPAGQGGWSIKRVK